MSNTKSENQSEQRVIPFFADNDMHFALHGPLDVEAAVESVEIDAAADRRWFKKHRNKNERRRLASVREQRAVGVPAGTVVHVRRGPYGMQFRTFLVKEQIN